MSGIATEKGARALPLVLLQLRFTSAYPSARPSACWRSHFLLPHTLTLCLALHFSDPFLPFMWFLTPSLLLLLITMLLSCCPPNFMLPTSPFQPSRLLPPREGVAGAIRLRYMQRCPKFTLFLPSLSIFAPIYYVIWMDKCLEGVS